MIVDADSWHMCRCLAYYGRDYEPGNLCRHFWKTIWATIWLGVTILLGLVSIALSIWLVFTNPWLLIGAGIATVMITIFIKNRQKAKPKARPEDKAPGFFSSWLKAKKGRYCPLIEVKGEETYE